MWELDCEEGWALRNWCFWTSVLEKTLESPLETARSPARRSNQSILKEISPEYSLEGLMLKLKLQYFDHLMRRTDSLEKTLMLVMIKGEKRRGRQRMRWLNGITDSIPGAYSNSCPSSWWCHPTISSTALPLSSTFNLSQHQGLFRWVSSSHEVAKVLVF